MPRGKKRPVKEISPVMSEGDSDQNSGGDVADHGDDGVSLQDVVSSNLERARTQDAVNRATASLKRKFDNTVGVSNTGVHSTKQIAASTARTEKVLTDYEKKTRDIDKKLAKVTKKKEKDESKIKKLEEGLKKDQEEIQKLQEEKKKLESQERAKLVQEHKIIQNALKEKETAPKKSKGERGKQNNSKGEPSKQKNVKAPKGKKRK